MDVLTYGILRDSIIEMGYGQDIDWCESVQAPTDAETFAAEYIFVVCNSGMKAQVARGIFTKVMAAIESGRHPSEVFGHKGKCAGIWSVWQNRQQWFNDFMGAKDKLDFLATMPWIGPITKYHLAKNFGINAAKPDRHLVRVADHYASTPRELCEKLAAQTGDRVGTVDYVIWRACNVGIIDSNKLGA